MCMALLDTLLNDFVINDLSRHFDLFSASIIMSLDSILLSALCVVSGFQRYRRAMLNDRGENLISESSLTLCRVLFLDLGHRVCKGNIQTYDCSLCLQCDIRESIHQCVYKKCRSNVSRRGCLLQSFQVC